MVTGRRGETEGRRGGGGRAKRGEGRGEVEAWEEEGREGIEAGGRGKREGEVKTQCCQNHNAEFAPAPRRRWVLWLTRGSPEGHPTWPLESRGAMEGPQEGCGKGVRV